MPGFSIQSAGKFFQDFLVDLRDTGVIALRFVLIFAVAWVVARIARTYVEPALSRRSFGRDGAILIGRLISIAAYVVAFVAFMNQLGADWTGILTLLSAFTVAVGLSLQDMMKNFFSGIIMLLERPFSVGDRVRVREFEGVIQGIDVRTTLIRNDDGALVMVPNAIMVGEVLTNRSYYQSARVRVTIAVRDVSLEHLDAQVANALASVPSVKRPLPHGEVLLRGSEMLKVRYLIPVTNDPGAEDVTVAALIAALPAAEIEVERV